MTCSLIEIYQRLGGTRCLNLHGLCSLMEAALSPETSVISDCAAHVAGVSQCPVGLSGFYSSKGEDLP